MFTTISQTIPATLSGTASARTCIPEIMETSPLKPENIIEDSRSGFSWPSCGKRS